jgi:acetyltransferase-like isoleucine patch superfamily enzyme
MSKIYKPLEFMQLFAHVGKEVQVFSEALILTPEVIELGDCVRIDDYSRIEGGKGTRIGKYVHICSFASIYGGGEAVIGDYCGITQGARLVTGTEQLNFVMTAAAPAHLRNPLAGKIIMEPNSFIGANAVVLPNITIGEGAVVGAGAVVIKDVPPWVIVAGVPARIISKRDRAAVLDLLEKREIKKSGKIGKNSH